ncbi:hypothetical protein HUW46_09347 [Amycolatopsis sp. CA-230715]|nr:hypothetical protein HUW46_09347 [Amycolatopsis sp. CA-230715]
MFWAAAPGVGLPLALVMNLLMMMLREFTWFGLVLAVVTVPLAVVAFSLPRMQLRTERRISTNRIAQYQALRQFLGTTTLSPVARPALPTPRSPRTWWRIWRTVWSRNRSGLDIPSDTDLDTLSTRLRTAATTAWRFSGSWRS